MPIGPAAPIAPRSRRPPRPRPPQEDDPQRLALVEVYTSEAGFAAHQATAHFAAWKRAVPDAGLLAEAPSVTILRGIFPTTEAGWRSAA